jgi:long-chain acyl-CoA synthetase
VNTNPLYTAPKWSTSSPTAARTGLVVIDLFADKVAQVLPKTSIRTVIVVTVADLLPFVSRRSCGWCRNA